MAGQLAKNSTIPSVQDLDHPVLPTGQGVSPIAREGDIEDMLMVQWQTADLSGGQAGVVASMKEDCHPKKERS
jgi:hypothetical protein